MKPVLTDRFSPMKFLRGTGFIPFIIKRILTSFLLIFGITFIAFSITQLVPGDPVAANLGQSAYSDPEIVAAFEKEFGLDQPVPVQYLRYIQNLSKGNFGISLSSKRPVLDDLKEYFPATMEIALVAVVLALFIGLILGTISAVTRDRLPDQIIRVFSLTGVSMPTFWTALVAFYLFFFVLGWAPGTGRLQPGAEAPENVTGLFTIDALLAGDFATFREAFAYLLLPAVVLAIYAVGVLTRFTRASVLEILGNDYVRTARSKGLSEFTVIRRHVLRPALLAIITVAGVAFASLMAGSVLVENVFSWPGLGQYAYRAAVGLDLPGIMGVSMVVATVYITMNLIVDVLYRVIDPQLRKGDQ
jgi:ABC-type dipeptide/oligopeptide/nickel transport system permease component